MGKRMSGKIAVIAAMMGGFSDWMNRPWVPSVPRWRRSGSKYKPHQGVRERARRMLQIGQGMLNPANRGTVKTAGER